MGENPGMLSGAGENGKGAGLPKPGQRNAGLKLSFVYMLFAGICKSILCVDLQSDFMEILGICISIAQHLHLLVYACHLHGCSGGGLLGCDWSLHGFSVTCVFD